MINRCNWVPQNDSLYIKYHDEEWGRPVYDDNKIFEFLVLESAQAGLSWITVLRKRENYRKAFANFDPVIVSKFGEKEIQEMLDNPDPLKSVIRNRLKIEAAINNAKKFLEIQNDFGTFSKYIWGFVEDKPIVNSWENIKQIPAVSKEAEALSKDLKKRGFKFLGPTVIYAHMQATGMVNDHITSCFCYNKKAESYF